MVNKYNYRFFQKLPFCTYSTFSVWN
jgi:hypothetical protein